jgi:hypothetical protein
MAIMKLRDYQDDLSTKGAEILRKFKILYFSMEVRTGKTFTALASFKKLGFDECLVITKKKAIKSIEADAEAIGINATVINYESLHKINQKFKCVIIDEAQSIGAYPKPTKRFKECQKHIDQNTFLIFLSGTPTPESFSQIYHQFAVHPLNPFAKFKTFYLWAREFVTIQKIFVANGRQVNDYSRANFQMIEPHIKHLMLSYTQKQAGFNQTIQEEVLTVPMKPITYKIAKSIMKNNIFEGKEKVVLADTGAKVLSKIHQIYSGTVIVEGGEAIIFDDSKAQFIKENFKGQKIAVFTKYKAEELLLKSVLKNVVDSPEDFNASTDATFVGQIQSSREGVNLSTADCLVYYNIDFSALSYLQGRDRATSKDRVKENKVFWIFAENGVESKIYDRVINKQDYTLRHYKNDRGGLSVETYQTL